jgi:Zn-dependent M28 family amino/carboxypeptidase
MIESGQTPTVRLNVQSEDLGVVPQFNIVASLPGTEKPDEYVLLGAHLDSWHSASGATDNGTGTITMLEAMRILKTAYPNPKRTILVGHWGAEEMGLIGSSSFREDHPEVIAGLQVAFNQDNGTWRFERLEGQGFQASSAFIPKWLGALPTEITSHIVAEVPGAQNNGGSDHTSFLCAGAPSFRLQSPYDEYRQYTWHTNRDTYDKIVFDDLAENATTAAMLAYMASEDPETVGREKANLPTSSRTGQARVFPECRPAQRSPR